MSDTKGHSQTVPAQSGLWVVAALLWLLVTLMVAGHQWSFWRSASLNTDVMALLPENERTPAVTLATRRLADRASRQVIVMLGATDWQAARRAAADWRHSLQEAHVPMQLLAALDDASMSRAIEFYRPWRDQLLTFAQREHLSHAAEAALVQTALAALYQPAASAKLSAWAEDPLSLWPQWWIARAGDTRARVCDGELWVAGHGHEWVVMLYEVTGPAIALSGRTVYADAIHKAEAAVRIAVPDVRVLTAGVPLHAEAAAARASLEVSTIGWGSLAAVMGLVWLAFRSVRPLALVGLSLLVGCASALSVTAMVFGHVHVMTLVFGATLVGVAEDYGIHYFAGRQGNPDMPPRQLLRLLLPGLWLAFATSVLAYLVLGLAAFPALRQMALFSAVGLAAAFLTVVCWFPWLDRGKVKTSRFASRVAGSLALWPRLTMAPRLCVAYVLVIIFCVVGLVQLRGNYDIRQLQSSPKALVQSQREVGDLLGVPSPAQFYIVQGASPEQVLQREEALKERLEPLVRAGQLAGYRAVSDWVPSQARQLADAELIARAELRVLAGVNATLGESLQRPARSSGELSLSSWLADPVSVSSRDLWLGEMQTGQGGLALASVVMLRGLHDPALLPRLESLSQSLDGVLWVDKVAEVSSLLKRYSSAMALLLLLGHVGVLGALWWRFGRAAWRAWLPTALASLLTLALLGWLGQTFQLFNVLALILLLGIGVDYGIFLLEHQGDGSAWLAVVLGASSTWLSLGMLVLSRTPALRAFGLTLLFGVALVWVLAPLLRPFHQESKGIQLDKVPGFT